MFLLASDCVYQNISLIQVLVLRLVPSENFFAFAVLKAGACKVPAWESMMGLVVLRNTV